ncbi:MAG: GHKL domain-containing protein [Solobacterium sp.]|nr:GHKL domain-containing protein [Solobacterium sp.]
MFLELYELYRTFAAGSTICFVFLLTALYSLFQPRADRRFWTLPKFSLAGAAVFSLVFQGILLVIPGQVKIFAVPIHFFYYFFCNVLSGFAFACLVLKGRPFAKLMYILFFVASIQVFRGIMSPLYRLEGSMDQTLYGCMDLGAECILYLYLWLLIRLFQKHTIHTSLKIDGRTAAAMLYLPLSILAAVMVEAYFPGISSALSYALILSAMPVIYFLSASLISRFEEQNRLDMALTRARAEQASMEREADLKTKLRQERHEIKNQYFHLQVLLRNGQYEELEQELERVSGRITENLKTLETGSVYLDYLLSEKAEKAKEAGIPFHTEILLPAGLQYNDTAAGTVLSNLLENAIEAERREEHPEIRIRMRQAGGYLYGEVRNAVSKDVLAVNPQLQTSKKDRQAHGYGLRIVKRILEEENGMLNLAVQDGYFTAGFMLEAVPASSPAEQ